MSEPTAKKSKCSYCGDAYVNHSFLYFDNLTFSIVDKQMEKVMKFVPNFIKDFVNLIPIFLFKTLIYFKVAHLSTDIDKANTFRSRLIWEEAERRGIEMRQISFKNRSLDWYVADIKGKQFYFESIPIQPKYLNFKKDWDNKIVLKEELSKHGVPVPEYLKVSILKFPNLNKIFSKIKKPVIIKPQVGSRSRHTITNISNLNHFKKAVGIVKKISPNLVVEEHLFGHVCRATVVGGVLAGFYKGQAPFIVGDGKKTIRELINDKDDNRVSRIEPIRLGEELDFHLERASFKIDDVLSEGAFLNLTHRVGRLFGGETKEMIDELHPSFIPILEKAAQVVGLSVVGFDCIIPDPEKEAGIQHWGIIECNTLPFIDLHYYALTGKPKNIAGMIWDLWE
jgi:cyanophycin synthetase